MTEPRPAAAEVDDEVAATAAKSAEDRKAASALASLDARATDDSAASARDVDQDAVNKAMKSLRGGASSSSASASAAAGGPAAAAASKAKAVKVDQADVVLLVDELELSKPKATELLKAHEGDAVRAMRAHIAV